MGRADAFGILLCFVLVVIIEMLMLVGGAYGPSTKDRGNMAARHEDVAENYASTMKKLKGNFE